MDLGSADGRRTPDRRRWGSRLEGIIADYADDAILIVRRKEYRGRDGAREVFTQLLSDVPKARWELDQTFADGMIRVQTVVYTLQPI